LRQEEQEEVGRKRINSCDIVKRISSLSLSLKNVGCRYWPKTKRGFDDADEKKTNSPSF
jgi:hypothetical protein